VVRTLPNNFVEGFPWESTMLTAVCLKSLLTLGNTHSDLHRLGDRRAVSFEISCVKCGDLFSRPQKLTRLETASREAPAVSWALHCLALTWRPRWKWTPALPLSTRMGMWCLSVRLALVFPLHSEKKVLISLSFSFLFQEKYTKIFLSRKLSLF
jgi:hypothetical protein